VRLKQGELVATGPAATPSSRGKFVWQGSIAPLDEKEIRTGIQVCLTDNSTRDGEIYSTGNPAEQTPKSRALMCWEVLDN